MFIYHLADSISLKPILSGKAVRAKNQLFASYDILNLDPYGLVMVKSSLAKIWLIDSPTKYGIRMFLILGACYIFKVFDAVVILVAVLMVNL